MLLVGRIDRIQEAGIQSIVFLYALAGFVSISRKRHSRSIHTDRSFHAVGKHFKIWLSKLNRSKVDEVT